MAKNSDRLLLAVLSLCLIAAMYILHANQREWDDCNSHDPDRSIAGCTHIIDRGIARRALSPVDPSAAYYQRASAYAKKRELDRSIADYDEVIRRNPKYSVAYLHRGNAYKDKADFDRALEDYSKSIRLDPGSAVSYAMRGTIYKSRGVLDRAIADYDEAIRKNPGYALAYKKFAAKRMKPRAHSIARSPTTGRPSVSTPNTFLRTKVGAVSTGPRVTSTARLPTLTRAFGSIQIPLWSTSIAPTPTRPKARSIARSGIWTRPSASIPTMPLPTTAGQCPKDERRPRSRHCRFQRGHPARSQIQVCIP